MQAQDFLNDLYLYLPGGFNHISNDYLDAVASDAARTRSNRPVKYDTNGQVREIINPHAYWGTP